MQSTRNAYGQALIELAKQNNNIVALSADLAGSTRLKKFAKKFPQRFFNVGLAEQDLIGTATGLALTGKIPFVSSFAVFCPGRCFEQIRNSVCLNNANVKIVSTHAGILTGPDGASHQMLEDIALMRVLPNMTILTPADFNQTKQAIRLAVKIKGPVYIRLTRPKTENITEKKDKLELSKIQILKPGKEISLLGYGPILCQGIKAANKLHNQIDVGVVNCPCLKPFDKQAVLKIAQETPCIITLEDHQVNGGLGSIVAEIIAQNKLPAKLICLGIKNKFGVSGKPEELIKKFKLDRDSLVEVITKNVRYKH